MLKKLCLGFVGLCCGVVVGILIAIAALVIDVALIASFVIVGVILAAACLVLVPIGLCYSVSGIGSK